MVRREYFYGIAKLLSIGHFMKWGQKQNGMPRRKRNEKCEKNRIKNTLDEHNNPTVDKFFLLFVFHLRLNHDDLISIAVGTHFLLCSVLAKRTTQFITIQTIRQI